jgi:SnoaL-like domain
MAVRRGRDTGAAPTRRSLLFGTGAVAALRLAPAAPAMADPGPEPAPNGVDPALAVAAIVEIKQVKSRYFQAIDTKNWDLLEEQLTDDVLVDTTGSGGPVTKGSAVFVNFLRVTLGLATTVHHGHLPEIEVTSPTTANGVWAMQDLLIFPAGARVIGFGHYHETYEFENDRWRISSTKLTRVYLDPLGQRQLFGM